MPADSRKALNRWAHDLGYADFDTYIAAGNSILEARREIAYRISSLESALRSLDSHAPAQLQQGAAHAQLSVAAEPDEPPDPHNAHPQGAEQ